MREVINLTKTCRACRMDLPKSSFVKNKRREDGLDSICKKCNNKRNAVKYVFSVSEVTCPECGKISEINKSNVKDSSHIQRCRDCYYKEIPSKNKYKRIDRKEYKCSCCDKSFWKLDSQMKGKEKVYCSRKCKNKGISLFYSGVNSPLWDHSMTLEDRIKQRKTEEYKKWRNQVYERDNYSCKSCGDDRGGNLVAHHILNYSEHRHLQTEVNNGITFCKECHKKFHDYYGYTKNNYRQIEEFLYDEHFVPQRSVFIMP